MHRGRGREVHQLVVVIIFISLNYLLKVTWVFPVLMELKELLVQQYKHLRRREGNWWLFHEVMKDESETAGEYVEVKLELCLSALL